jgi:hypothetical protein
MILQVLRFKRSWVLLNPHCRQLPSAVITTILLGSGCDICRHHRVYNALRVRGDRLEIDPWLQITLN